MTLLEVRTRVGGRTPLVWSPLPAWVLPAASMRSEVWGLESASWFVSKLAGAWDSPRVLGRTSGSGPLRVIGKESWAAGGPERARVEGADAAGLWVCEVLVWEPAADELARYRVEGADVEDLLQALEVLG